MTTRFDAILFDAGGIFLLPDPISLGAIVRAHGGDGSIERLVRAHYAGTCACVMNSTFPSFDASMHYCGVVLFRAVEQMGEIVQWIIAKDKLR